MIAEYLNKHLLLAAGLQDSDLINQVEEVVAAIRRTKLNGGTVYTIGNGGSAATASHFVNDLVLLGYRAVALTDNAPVIMAIANDFSYEEVFLRQLQGCYRFPDLLVAFSCSGESKNVLRGVEYVNDLVGKVIGFCGDANSSLHRMAEIAIAVPGGVQHQEDAHLVFCHAIYVALKGGG